MKQVPDENILLFKSCLVSVEYPGIESSTKFVFDKIGIDYDISDKQILDVMEQIGAIPLLERLDNGLDEVVDVNRLSKGELQVIAFIRAIVHKANIYIFDEPTSNIDLRTEKMIQRIIDKISKNSTVIIIAHRLSTIQNVDRVLKLKDSSILSN